MFAFNVGAIDELETAEDLARASVPPLALATYEAQPTKSTAEVKIYPSRLIQ